MNKNKNAVLMVSSFLLIMASFLYSCGQVTRFEGGRTTSGPELPPAEQNPWASYCGDGQVNQSWEQCDGGASCSESCQSIDPAIPAPGLRLAKLAIREHSSDGQPAPNHFALGTLPGILPSGVWVALTDSQANPIVDAGDRSQLRPDAEVVLWRDDQNIDVILHAAGANRHLRASIDFDNARLHLFANSDRVATESEWPMDGIREVDPLQDEVWSDRNRFFVWFTTDRLIDLIDGAVVAWRETSAP